MADVHDIADDRQKELDDLALAIRDETFYRHLVRLKKLQEFLYAEAVPIDTSNIDALTMGDLSGLHPDPRGRMPTAEEWAKVEARTQAIFRIFTPAMRRKFLMGETPWVAAWLPVYFLGFAVLSLVLAMVIMNAVDWPEYFLFIDYLIWLVSLGAIGASAFIGMNALSLQDDITFDLTNIRLMSLRISLGALFGVVLSLPFGFPEFVKFCKLAWRPSVFYDPKLGAIDIAQEAVFLLLPFIFGFSTSLVILVLTQLAEAVQTFLGRKPKAESSGVR
ncbi:hypothetical protein [Bradyrhizobium sp. CB3481]|uniref:hypothetical protein n=1 Tax=Bradyrhizobium sp. CB3481 TaxID=3039158 RepID=UPI0024B1757A|nr:hypothetical protein [Bradyrhizobium sp. CB3481]WFU19941.1 hypothetical protein QA643_17220 [Bradyrhizobium sp. CB3481]